MMARRTAFEKIEEGLKEALEIARGNAKPAKIIVPPEIDMRAIRAKTALSQEDFAAVFGFTVHQIRQWEQGRSRPLGALRAYLMIIDRDPESIKKLLRQTAPARMAA